MLKILQIFSGGKQWGRVLWRLASRELVAVSSTAIF